MPRKRLALLVVASLVTLVTLASSAYEGEAASKTTLYLALGDSLGTGYGASVPSHDGYVPRVFASGHGTPHAGVNVLSNQSAGGETTGTMIANGQLAAGLGLIADPSTDTALVTLDIGGDDLLPLLQEPACATDPTSLACQAAVAGALSNVASNLPTIVGSIESALAAEGTGGRLLVMTYYNPFSGTGSPFEAAVDQAELGADGKVDCAALANPANVGLNDLITCTAQALGATVVDVYPAFVGRGTQLTHIAQGDIHPTDAGYALIAHLFLRALQGG